MNTIGFHHAMLSHREFAGARLISRATMLAAMPGLLLHIYSRLYVRSCRSRAKSVALWWTPNFSLLRVYVVYLASRVYSSGIIRIFGYENADKSPLDHSSARVHVCIFVK
ncbi:hypothetical protein BJ166DRAFT_379753 [Pestalotiopsis sp. NC0098]|nr:hypothetical protein BJ166DRAFT_379753 [Pestalotiopsis sp. NC0098]